MGSPRLRGVAVAVAVDAVVAVAAVVAVVVGIAVVLAAVDLPHNVDYVPRQASGCPCWQG